MSKTLIIAEKPSVGRDIAAALPSQRFTRAADGSHLEADRVIITWAIGHLVQLADPEDYTPEWKRWRMDTLPMIPDTFKLKPAPKTSKQLTAIKKLLKRNDVTQIINACDAGREGELIFRYIMQSARCAKPVRRLWLASMTAEAIKNGLANTRPGAEYDGLADAARCRSEADWLVGMNSSRAATIILRLALGGSCSVGRVQTPTLAILVARELEIRNFVPEDYWIVEALFQTETDSGARTYTGTYRDGHRMTTQAEADAIVAAVRGQHGTITKLDRKDVTEKAPALYDLTTLQREASNAFGWTAKKTLEVAQRLYEQSKLLTYPRTDSRWLTSDIGKTLPGLLAQLARTPDYAPHIAAINGGALPLTQVVNDKKVSDHHAIIPTGKMPPSGLAVDDKKLFDMVARRFLAALSPASLVGRTRVETTVNIHVFVTKGRVVKQPGWRAVYAGVGWFKTEEQILPELHHGEAVRAAKTNSVAKQTQPPKRFSDAGLLGAMETAGKLVDDDEAREAMKESGLGTPATRASIIERLVKVAYVRREKKLLIPTEKGIQLIGLLGDHPLASPALTGEWERRLGQMQTGTETRTAFMSDLVAFSTETVERIARLAQDPAVLEAASQAVAEDPKGATNTPSIGACPNCKQPLRETAKSWTCWSPRDPGCGMTFWKTIAGRKIPKKVVLELIGQHRTSEKVTGFKSKSGKTFDAHLKLARNADGSPKVTFDFDR